MGADVDLLKHSSLSPPCRLALGYATTESRPAIAAVFALDARLARAGAEASEPIIAQMKLAWWRDQFAKPVADWPVGEPLLAAIAQSRLPPARLSALVDGWEALAVSDRLEASLLEAFSAGRAASWLAIAEALGMGSCGEEVLVASRQWALGELGSHLAGEARASLHAIAQEEPPPVPHLPRPLRPLQVLAALAHRARLRDRPLLDGVGALALALRVGISGR